MFSSLTDARKWVKKKRVQKIVEMRILSLIFVFFFNDATVEERDEVSYKGNNFCYKACPVANSFFFFYSDPHSRTQQLGGKERHSARSSCTFAWLHLGIFFLSFSVVARLPLPTN